MLSSILAQRPERPPRVMSLQCRRRNSNGLQSVYTARSSRTASVQPTPASYHEPAVAAIAPGLSVTQRYIENKRFWRRLQADREIRCRQPAGLLFAAATRGEKNEQAAAGAAMSHRPPRIYLPGVRPVVRATAVCPAAIAPASQTTSSPRHEKDSAVQAMSSPLLS